MRAVLDVLVSSPHGLPLGLIARRAGVGRRGLVGTLQALQAQYPHLVDHPQRGVYQATEAARAAVTVETERSDAEPWRVYAGLHVANEEQIIALHDALRPYRERPEERPRRRSECPSSSTPCPWVLCRHHLWLAQEVDHRGALIRLDRPEIHPLAMEATCALNAASEPRTLEEVGDLLGVTRERVRQIELRALEKLKESGEVGALLGRGV